MTTLEKVKSIVAQYERLSAACKAVRDVGAMDINGELHNAIWLMFEKMLIICDHDEWVWWYIYENQCGKRKMKAGYDGKLRIIDTPEKLVKLIERK